MRLSKIACALFLCFLGAPVHAQEASLQGGPFTPGHSPMYVGQGSVSPVLQDSGPAGGGGIDVGLSEQLLVARGTGTPPFVGQGTGPSGTNWCDYDAPLTSLAGYHFLCLSANAQGGGLMTYGAGGAASPLPLQFLVNGSYTVLGGSSVSSVTAGDTTLTISPTTGSVVASINLANPNNWTGKPYFSSVSDWTGTYISGLPTSAQVRAISSLGEIGFAGSSKTSAWRAANPTIPSPGFAGVVGLGVDDDTSFTNGGSIGIGGDFEAVIGPSAHGIAISTQMDINNGNGVVDQYPYGVSPDGENGGLLVTSGTRSASLYNPSWALSIQEGAQAHPFRKGILVVAGALDTGAGTTGGGVFAELPNAAEIRWFNSSVVIEAELWGAANGINVSTGLAVAGGIEACELGSTCANNGGSIWSAQYHADWSQINSSFALNPTEFQIYNTFAQGKAHCDNPGVTGVVDWDSGTAFNTAWAGRTAFYLGVSTTGVVRTVSSVASASQLTLSTTCQGSGSVTFMFGSATNDGVVNVSSTAVTWVSGQTFNVDALGTNEWTINGSPYTCTVITSTTATCNTSGTLTGVAYHTDFNDYDTTSLLRVQKISGANEENLAITARATGVYEIRAEVAGAGSYNDILIGSGASGGSVFSQIDIHSDGNLSLGNGYGADSLRIQGNTGGSATNFLYVPVEYAGSDVTLQAGANTTDTNVNIALVPKGVGVVKTSGDILITSVAIASLPSCGATNLGALATVSNGTAYGTGVYGSAVSATGAVTRQVSCANTAGPTTYAWAYN